MNKIFKTKYDVTTGQCKAVSELASNRLKSSSCFNSTLIKVPFTHFMFNILSLAVALTISPSSLAFWIVSEYESITSKGYENTCINKEEDSAYCRMIALNSNTNSNAPVQIAQYAVAIGYESKATGTNGVSVGRKSQALGNSSVAIGRDSIAKLENAVALGRLARGFGSQSVSVGNNSVAESQSVALGSDVYAIGKSSIAIGNDDVDSPLFNDKLEQEDINSIYKTLKDNPSYFSTGAFNKTYIWDAHAHIKDRRIYSPTLADGIGAIAIGSRTVAKGNLSTSLGSLSFALSDFSTALGTRAYVDQNANGGTAIGSESRVFARGSLAVGNFNESTSDGAMSYGFHAKAVGENTIAIGAYVGAGGTFNDEGKQRVDWYKEILSETNTDGFDAKDHFFSGNLNADGSKDFSNFFENDGKVKLTIDKKSITKLKPSDRNKGGGRNGIVIGGRSFTLGKNGLALGYSALSQANNSFAVGSYSFTGDKAENAMALGVRAYTEGKNSIALGYRAMIENKSNDRSSPDMKNKQYYSGENSMALGIETKASLNNSLALGYQSETDYLYSDLEKEPYTPKDAITIPTSGRTGVISVGKKAHERRIVNVAAGYLDTDAVNVAQLKSLEGRVDLLSGSQESEVTPYFGVDQSSIKSEAKAITEGQKAQKNYDRYVHLAGQYAQLLNRKKNNGENFNEETLKKIKVEIDKLGSTNKIKETADAITKILEELTKNDMGSDHKDPKKLKEFEDKIEKALVNDGKQDKKAKLTQLTEKEIIESNYKGNLAKGKDSIAIGYAAQTKDKAEHAIAIGYKAKTKDIGAIAIGDNAIVEENTGESIALGKDSKAKAKEEAKKDATVTFDSKKVKFQWTGGVSLDNTEENKKSVLSIGDTNKQRIIKHVAAGAVTVASTDAINGSQLYAVANEFSKLAVNVLGAEVEEASKTGFKKSKFEVAKYNGHTTATTPAEMTFKDAIGQNTTAINKGFIFGDASTTGTLYLGDTLKIQPGAIDTPSTITGTKDTYSPNNIKTFYQTNSKTLLIGIKDEPTFKKVTLSKEQTYPSGTEQNKVGSKDLITKGYLDGALKNVATSFNVQGDSGDKFKVQETLSIKGADSTAQTTAQSAGTTSTAHKNITTKASSNTLEIALNEDIKEVNSISGKEVAAGKQSNGKKVKSELVFNIKNEQTSANTNVVIKSNGAIFAFDRTGLHLSTKQITGVASGLGLNGKAGSNSTIIANVLSGNTDTGNTNDKKIANNAVNVQDLSTIAKAIIDKGLKFQGNDANNISVKLGGTLKIIGEKTATTISGTTATTQITTAPDNITVAKKNGTNNGTADTLEIKLSDNLKGIKSVANNATKIELNNGSGGSGSNAKSIVFTAGDTNNKVTLTEGKFTGVSEISSKDSKSKLTLNADKATVELAHDKSKLELKDTEATITAGASAGSIKITSNGSKKIELSPENGATLTFTKSNSDKVKISGVASGLGDSTANTNNIENVLTGTSIDTIQNNAINVKDLSDVAKAIIGKGLTFAGNDGTANVALGETITIKGDGSDVDIKATASDVEKALTLTLNKETAVKLDSNKVVTSKAVAEELKKYTQRDTLVGDLEEYYLEIDGANVKDKAIFGSNIGIDKINLKEDETEGTSELVQAKALVDYLKGTGDKSVKLSDSAKTQAIGTGSISIGHNAVSQNEGSIALGYNSSAKNQGAISIGQDSDVLGLSSISVGKENKVEGHYSFVLGESNTIMKEQTYVIGSDNKIFGNRNISIGSYNNIEGNENILLGSHIQMDETIRDAIVLGNSSQGVEGALSVGSAIKRRKIVFVADPTNPYDAVNKRYLEARGIKFKGTENGEHLVKLDQLLTIDSSESKVSQNQASSNLTDSMEKDIKTKVEVNGDGTKLILTLNKTDSVSENDERAVTAKAVHTAINAVKQDLTNVEISYKANDTGAKKVKLSDGFNFKDGTNTTAVVEDKGIVKFNLNKELKDMTSFEIEAKDGNKAKLDQSGLTVGDKDATNGDKTHAVYGKDGLTVHGKDGQSAVSLKVKNENGKGTATLEFAKDDEKSTGAITGLKDLDEKSTGDMAANKNYVDEKFGEVDKKLDEKIASANSNRPFDYYAGEEKVVKGQDGQFYKPDEIKDTKFEDGKYKAKDGQEVKTTVKQDDVVIKAEPKTGPMKITNVKDGDLTIDSKDAVNGSQLAKATGAKFIDDPNSTEPKAKKMVFADGKDGKSGLEANSMAMKSLTGKDGLNGQNANDKANALRNGEAGAVVFTDNKGERLVKANDGKYYKATDVENNGMPKGGKSAVDNPQLSLVNTDGETDKPVVLGNVASGLDIDADKAKEAVDKTNNANKVVRDKAKDLSDKVSDMLKKGEELDTLRFSKEAQQDAVDALETALKYMPEETDAEKEAKSRVKDNLKREKQKLSELTDKFTEAEKRVKEAKEAVEKAKDTLEASKSSYENALKESNREINALLSGDEKINVHRGANLQDLQALGQAGLNFEGNDGVPVHKNLGEKLTIKGEGEFNSATTAAGNIKVDASATGLEVKLSDKLKNMTSFETKETAEGNKSRLDGNGLRVTHKDGKSAQYGVDGVRLTDGKHSATLTPSGLTLTNPQDQRIEIDGEKGEIRVPDLTPNSSPNAVVNKGYVDSLHSQTAHKLETTDKNLRAGIAGANAAAALPTISIPGSSLLAVSAGTYKGQSAVALGYSRVSDNGKVLLKLHGNSNSVGDFGGGVGIGWAW